MLWLIYLMGSHMLHSVQVEVSRQHCRVLCFSPSTFTWVSGQTQATRLRQHAFSPRTVSLALSHLSSRDRVSIWTRSCQIGVMLVSQFWGVPGSAEVTVWLAIPAFLWLLGIQAQAFMLAWRALHRLNHAASPSYILFWYEFLILLEKTHHHVSAFWTVVRFILCLSVWSVLEVFQIHLGMCWKYSF